MRAGLYNLPTTEHPAQPERTHALSEGEVVDRYVVVGWLGEGGVATVFRARHTTLNTAFALKLLKIPRHDLRERLLREGRLQASLQHPNIVRVHDVLNIHGSPALVLDLIEGPSLREELVRGPLEREALLGIARALVSALAHAHDRGVVHRDLKPANILLERRGRLLEPHITDFGIARLLEVTPEIGTTLTGGLLGTMAYMAPEQLRCSRDVGTRADIFSLGVILYEMSRGQRPFAAVESDPIALAEAIRAARYAPTGEARPELPAALHEAIASCLREDPAQRPDAAALYEALWPAPTHQPAAPTKPSPASQPRRLLFSAAVVGAAALGGWELYAPSPAVEPGAASPAAIQPPAQDARVEAAALEASAWRVAHKDAAHTLALLRAAASLAPAQAGRLLDPLTLARLQRAGANARAITHTEQIKDMAITADGKRIAVGLIDGSIKLWERTSGALLWSNDASMDAEINMVQFMPGDRQLLATPRLKNTLHLNPRPALMLDTRNGAVRHTFAHGSVLSKFGFSQDQRWGFSVGQDNRVQLWDLHTGAPVETMRTSELHNTHCIAISAQNRWMATGTAGTVSMFDAQRWERLKIVGKPSTDLQCTLLFEEGAATILHSTASGLSRWSIPGGRRLTLASHKPHIKLIPSPDGRSLLEHDERGAALTDLVTLERRATLEGHQGRIMAAAFSPDGAQIITASTDNTARIWSGASGEPLLTLRGHTSWVFSAALLLEGDQPVAVTGGRDGTLRQWSLPAGTARSILPNREAFEQLTLSRDWSTLIIRRSDRHERWRIDQGEPVLLSSQPVSPDAGGSFSQDGAWFVLLDYANSLLVHEGQEIPLPRHEGRPGQIRVASDGSVLRAFGSIFSFWRPGQTAWTYHTLAEQLESSAISTDGTLMVVATHNDLHVGRADEFKTLKRSPSKRPETVSAMLISPDKRWLALMTWGGELELWDLEQERQIERITPHADSITRVALMPDGSGFVTSSLDRTIKRWSWGKLTPEATLRGHEIDILALTISEDGRRLASGDKEGLVIVWDLATAQPLHARWATNAVEALHFAGDELEGLDMGRLRWRWSLATQPPGASNYRVCRATGAVVPVIPFPPADTVWAPEDACR